MTMDDAERITRLEEKLTHLETHVTEQDKVILGLTEDLERLRRELTATRERIEDLRSGENPPIDQRPPHY